MSTRFASSQLTQLPSSCCAFQKVCSVSLNLHQLTAQTSDTARSETFWPFRFSALQSLQHTFCYTYDIINVACRCGLYNVRMISIIIVLSWNAQCPHLTFSEGKSDHQTTIFQGRIDVTVTVRMNLVSFL
jgi:hypothetical protein